MDLSKTEKYFEGLMSLFLRVQFIQSCGRDLTLFLKEKGPKNNEEMALIADHHRKIRHVNAFKYKRGQRSGIDTIKYHT